MKQSIHQFSITAIDGAAIDFSHFEGKKILLVNVASECGLTGQYQQLQEMHQAFDDKVIIVGCPANNFGAQEPGTDAQIQEFCTLNYGVKFPMSSKISVKGADMHELYQFATEKAKNGYADSEVQWNFQKYIFDEQGYLIKVIAPTTEPASDEVLSALGIEY